MNSNKFHDHGSKPKMNPKLKLIKSLKDNSKTEKKCFGPINKDKPIKK